MAVGMGKKRNQPYAKIWRAIDDLRADVALIKTDVAVVKTDISWMRGAVNGLEVRIDRLEARIDRLDNRLWWVLGSVIVLGIVAILVAVV